MVPRPAVAWQPGDRDERRAGAELGKGHGLVGALAAEQLAPLPHLPGTADIGQSIQDQDKVPGQLANDGDVHARTSTRPHGSSDVSSSAPSGRQPAPAVDISV